MTVTKKLKDECLELIEAHGLTGAQVSTMFGVSTAWLSHLKSGRINNPSVDVMQRIYEALSGVALLGEKKSDE